MVRSRRYVGITLDTWTKRKGKGNPVADGSQGGPTKIDQPIVGYSVAGEDQKPGAQGVEPTFTPPDTRPEVLYGRTYKIHPPMEAHALYITINDVLVNEGTEHEHLRPFEIFLNSKDMESFQWIVALTRVISGIFRKGGDMEFLVEELRSVFHPNGGYWLPGGKWQPSVVAHIGEVVQRHLYDLGLIEKAPPKSKAEQKKEEQHQKEDASQQDHTIYEYCGDCGRDTAHKLDGGCPQCLECGHAKCG